MAELRVVYKGKFVGTLPRPTQRRDAVRYTLGDAVVPEFESAEYRPSCEMIRLSIYPFCVDDPDNPVCSQDADSYNGWCVEFAGLVDTEEFLDKVRQIPGWKANPPKRIIELSTF